MGIKKQKSRKKESKRTFFKKKNMKFLIIFFTALVQSVPLKKTCSGLHGAQCNPNGTFLSVQCDQDSGCFCVSRISGRKIPNSSMKFYSGLSEHAAMWLHCNEQAREFENFEFYIFDLLQKIIKKKLFF